MHSIEQQVALKSARLNTIPADWHLGSVGNDCYILNNLRMPISEDERRKMNGPYPYYGPSLPDTFISHFNIYI